MISLFPPKILSTHPLFTKLDGDLTGLRKQAGANRIQKFLEDGVRGREPFFKKVSSLQILSPHLPFTKLDGDLTGLRKQAGANRI